MSSLLAGSAGSMPNTLSSVTNFMSLDGKGDAVERAHRAHRVAFQLAGARQSLLARHHGNPYRRQRLRAHAVIDRRDDVRGRGGARLIQLAQRPQIELDLAMHLQTSDQVGAPWTVFSPRMGVTLITMLPLVNSLDGKRNRRELRGGGRPAADIHRGQAQEHVKRNLRAVIHA